MEGFTLTWQGKEKRIEELERKIRRTGVLGQDRAFAEDHEGTPENAGLCEGGPGSGKFI